MAEQTATQVIAAEEAWGRSWAESFPEFGPI